MYADLSFVHPAVHLWWYFDVWSYFYDIFITIFKACCHSKLCSYAVL